MFCAKAHLVFLWFYIIKAITFKVALYSFFGARGMGANGASARVFKVALYSFFGARGMGANGASARVFKRKVKNKNKHGGETFIASRVPLIAILFDQNKCSSKNA